MPLLRRSLKTTLLASSHSPVSSKAPNSHASHARVSDQQRLDQVQGGRVQVVAVEGADALSERLTSAGLEPGVIVELLARAPFGGPMLFRVQGYRLALRRSEAARVRVAEHQGGTA